MDEQDFEKTVKVNNPGGLDFLPNIDLLKTDTALLRRIAYNTNMIRLVLIWTMVIVPIVLLAIAIPMIVVSAHTTGSVTNTCVDLYSTC